MNNDELMHYGVLGMKWGVHRGHASKAYGKASKKLNKLENKVDKAEQKADKAMYKADKRSYGFFLLTVDGPERPGVKPVDYRVKPTNINIRQ